jgi:hypothetical protein
MSSLLLDHPLTPHGKFLEEGEGCYLRSCMMKITNSSRDMLKKNFKPFLEAQKSVSPEGLHEALRRSFPEHLLKIFPAQVLFGKVVIIKKQVHPLITTEFDIRIAEERAEIVKGASKAHSLKIDKEGFPVTDHHILRLKIPVNETAYCPDEPFRQTGKFHFEFTFDGRLKLGTAEILHKMIPEIILLPAIEIGSEALHELHMC